MIKTIKIDDKDVKFSFSLASFYIYKNQFGQDAMSVILPLLADVIGAIDPEIIVENGEISSEKLVKTAGDIFDQIISVEITEVADIIWAFAKAADDEIPEPALWYGNFEEFPLFDVGKELLPCLYDSLISKKKILKNTQIATTKKKSE
jgi:prophage pi2 protein 40|uniref:Tail assembly chaperone protein n=1 Tax=Siphoviridae sp. ctZUr4 TaxID=2827892 RepID=A0A8S5STE8_9CAUD|nr:MAG TPA: tail assembly chaperone protein [Siphoviridae sp. ctZUr4]